MSLIVLFRHKGTVHGPDEASFNAEKAAHELFNGLKGLGTDEKTIIHIIGTHNNAQRQQIKEVYKSLFGKDLLSDLDTELGGHFLEACTALLCQNHLYDAHCIKKSLRGINYDEIALIETLCTRANPDIQKIRECYSHEFSKNLEDDLIDESHSIVRKILRTIVVSGRPEGNKPDATLAEKEAALLVVSGVGLWGTEDSIFQKIFCGRHNAQLKATFAAYKKKTSQDVEQAIRKEFNTDSRESLLALVKVFKNPIAFFAERIHDALKGPGSDDERLIRIIVSRCETDLQSIKEDYQKKYKKSLAKAVKDDCSGDYCRMLLIVIGSE